MPGKSGKHNPDDVLIGLLDSPEIKAFSEFAAEADGFDNVADWFRAFIFERGTAHGMMVDGRAVGEWRDKVIVRAAAIRQQKRERSEAIKRRRAAAKASQSKEVAE